MVTPCTRPQNGDSRSPEGTQVRETLQRDYPQGEISILSGDRTPPRYGPTFFSFPPHSLFTLDQHAPCVTPSPHTLCSSGTPIPPLLHAPVPRPVVHVHGAGAYCRLCEEFQAGQHHPDESWWTGCVALPGSHCLGYIQHFACSRHNMFAEHITLCWPWCSLRFTPIAISSARSCPIVGLKETLPQSSCKILLNRPQ